MCYAAAMAAKSQWTRERILEAARRAFNRAGWVRTDTHDVAREARMSPGNLYYHYPDKKAIVRDLFERIEIYDEQAWRNWAASGAEAFPAFLDFFFGSALRHRFFFLDFSALMREDPTLARRWRVRHERLSAALAAAARAWVDAGLMRPFGSEEDAQAFVDNAWILCHYAAAYVQAKAMLPAEQAHADGLRLVISFLRPYHTPAGHRHLDRCAARLGASKELESARA